MQVRVIEPCVHSVGPGICAVLVTAQSCFLWLGHEANTSEKIKVCCGRQVVVVIGSGTGVS